MHLSMIEHGAYRLMIDYCYISEKPLPLDSNRIYAVVRAQSKAERAAVDMILSEFFSKSEIGWQQKRVSEELEIYAGVVIKNQLNGNRGGRPKKTQSVISGIPQTEPKHNLSQNPESSNQEKTARDPPPVQESTAPENREADARAAPSKSENTPENPYAAMAISLRNQGVECTSMHPLVVQWVDRGIAVAQALAAIEQARMRKPKPEKIPIAYLDPIVAEIINPRAIASAVQPQKPRDTCTHSDGRGTCGMPHAKPDPRQGGAMRCPHHTDQFVPRTGVATGSIKDVLARIRKGGALGGNPA